MSQIRSLFTFSRSPLSHKELFDNVLVISVIATFIFTANAFLVIQNPILGVLNLGSTLFFIGMLYLSKMKGNYKLAYQAYSIYLLLIINAVWFMGGGYDGFNGYVMMLLLTVFVVIREKTRQLWILGIVILNVIILFLIEYRFPDLPLQYPEPINQISQGLVLIMSLITLYYFLYTLKKNYRLQKQIADSSNKELENRNQQIHKQNQELTRQSNQLETQKAKLEAQSKELAQKVEERTFELSKANEDLVSKNIKLDQFTGILAHNLKGPVARIKGLSELLKYENQAPHIKEALIRVRESILDLDQVLRDLQTILDIQRGTKSGFENVDVQTELQKSLALLETDIQEKNVQVTKHIETGLTIRGYKAYVQSIFHNLISNSVKFSSEDRQPIIKIFGQKENGKVNIEVEDNGVGIEMKYANDKIFQLYQRFNYDHPGKGVGLYLVKTQVEAMHGSIELKSELKKGTTFKIAFETN